MNFTKSLRTPFLQNTSGPLLCPFYVFLIAKTSLLSKHSNNFLITEGGFAAVSSVSPMQYVCSLSRISNFISMSFLITCRTNLSIHMRAWSLTQ